MKYKMRIAVVCALIIAGIFLWQKSAQAPHNDSLAILKVGESKLAVEFARTSEEHARGLMYRTSLPEDSGMLFLFSESRPPAGGQTFWNKNTLIPLDIIWVQNRRVVSMSQLPAIADGLKTVTSPELVDAVLEVNLDWAKRHGIKIGDALEW